MPSVALDRVCAGGVCQSCKADAHPGFDQAALNEAVNGSRTVTLQYTVPLTRVARRSQGLCSSGPSVLVFESGSCLKSVRATHDNSRVEKLL